MQNLVVVPFTPSISTALHLAVTDSARQMREIIAAISPELYIVAEDTKASSIGAHFRHIIEFMQMLSAHARLGFVDYDLRERKPELEHDREAAINAITACAEDLINLLRHSADMSLTLYVTPAVGAEKLAMTSNLSREVMYVLEHTVHHLAIIKMLATRYDVLLSEQVGTAVATAEYLKKRQG